MMKVSIFSGVMVVGFDSALTVSVPEPNELPLEPFLSPPLVFD